MKTVIVIAAVILTAPLLAFWAWIIDEDIRLEREYREERNKP